MCKILIVEDDNAMAQMCAKLIRRRGHSAIIAGSGQDALAIVTTTRDVDAVLTDIQMPDITGVELMLRLRQVDSHLPIVLMTGYASAVSSDEAYVLGATDYLSKPFDADVLIGSLERALRMRPVKVPEHV